jgi:hypothetical protein
LDVEPGSYSQATLQVAPMIKSAESSTGMPLILELRERTIIHDQPFEVKNGKKTERVLEIDLGASVEFIAEDRAALFLERECRNSRGFRGL